MSSISSPKPKSHRRDDSQSSYYFVNQGAGTSLSVRDAGDETEVIEAIPYGARAESFSPRAVNSIKRAPTPIGHQRVPMHINAHHSDSERGDRLPWVLDFVFGKKGRQYQNLTSNDFSGAKKVDPKVFFSKERTFMSWMHTSIWLAGTSMGITAYSDTGSASAIYGLMMMPIAIVFIIYAMMQYAKRSYMIATRSPGPYEDRWGPVVLGSLVVASLIAQFIFKLYETA